MYVSGKYQGSRSAAAFGATLSVMLVAGLSLVSGCQRKDDDSILARQRLQVIKRTDQFQATAANGKIAVIVGGGVVVTADLQGGALARTVLPGTPALIDVAACADGSFVALDFYRKVWLAGGDGRTWTAQAIPGSWRPLALTCDARNRIWVVGSGTTIASSTDRGVSWAQRDLKQDAMFNTVQFVDGGNGFITGEFGAVYRTADGGATWTAEARISSDFYPYAAHFITASEGYVAGIAGAMLRTRDAGKTWAKLDNPSALPQFGLTQAGGAMYSVGIGGSVQRLDGDLWRPVDYNGRSPNFLRALMPVSGDRLLIAGASGAMQMVPVAAGVVTAIAAVTNAAVAPASPPTR